VRVIAFVKKNRAGDEQDDCGGYGAQPGDAADGETFYGQRPG